jgi:hypothetical protein
MHTMKTNEIPSADLLRMERDSEPVMSGEKPQTIKQITESVKELHKALAKLYDFEGSCTLQEDIATVVADKIVKESRGS